MVSRLIYGAHLATPTASAPSLRQPFHKVRDLPVPLVRLKLKGRRALSCDADEYVPASPLEPDHLWAALPNYQPKLAAEELFRCRQRRVRRQRGSRLIAHQNLHMCQAPKGTAWRRNACLHRIMLAHERFRPCARQALERPEQRSKKRSALQLFRRRRAERREGPPRSRMQQSAYHGAWSGSDLLAKMPLSSNATAERFHRWPGWHSF